MEPNFFIVGAPKCGTTSMHAYLAQHPDIAFPERKEPKYFGADLHMPGRMEQAAYQALFDGIQGVRWTGEGMVYKLYSRTAAAEIRAAYPDSRILIMLRHPADFMYSLYFQNRYETIEDADSFEQALAREPEVLANFDQYKARMEMPHRLLYRDNARFADQVQRYLDVFPPDQVLVLGFAQLAADAAGAVGRVLEFLDLPPAAVDLTPVNEAKRTRSPALRRLLAQRPALLSRTLGRVLPDAGKKWLHRRLKMANSAQQRKAPLDPTLRAALVEEFAPEVARIEQLAGVVL